MKKNLSYIFTCAVIITLLSGCALLQPKQVQVRKTPGHKTYILKNAVLRDGYQSTKSYWIAYSDRDPNTTITGPENEMPLKKMGFMHPLYIVKEKGNYVKVIQYNSDLDLSETKGKLPRKAAKNYGWIKKDRLLLWSTALQDYNNSFVVKAVTHFGGDAVFMHPQRFVGNDSLLLFHTPSLQLPSGRKIKAGSIVYPYKQSEDGKSLLIGAEPFITTDNAAQTMLGWISKDAVSVWGTRSAFGLIRNAPDSVGLYLTAHQAIATDSFQPLLNHSGLSARSIFENIFPLQNKRPYSSQLLQSGYLDNIMDYTHNSVYNVLGDSIAYPQYQRIVTNSNRVNIVLVLDVSANNSNYFPLIKSAVQDLQLYFDTTTLLKNCRFGVVTYRQKTCAGDRIPDVLQLSSDFQQVEKYIENKLSKSHCGGESVYQPLYRGIVDACRLLQSIRDETNIIAVIGTTGSDDTSNYTLFRAIGKLSYVQARLLIFQSISKSGDAYNDFVLSAEKMITSTAASIAELKKNKLVDINDVIDQPSYNMRHGDSGIYSLDYPHQSMTQGFALFPKKGALMPAGTFRQYFDSLIVQIIQDNQNINRKLHDYFQTVGIKSTSFRPEFDQYTGKLNMNTAIAKTFTTSGNNFFIPAYIAASPGSLQPQPVSFGLLLNEPEYDRQMEQFYAIYAKTAATEKFRKKCACHRYKKFLKHYVTSTNIKPMQKIKRLTLGEALYTCTGFISQDSLYNTMTLHKLKKQNKKMVLDVFNGFKYAADALQEKKNTGSVKMNNNGQSYYHITADMMPGTVMAKKEEE